MGINKKIFYFLIFDKYVFSDGVQPRLLFDKSVSVKQLDVVEELELVLLRTDKGKNKRIHFFGGSCFVHLILHTEDQ